MEGLPAGPMSLNHRWLIVPVVCGVGFAMVFLFLALSPPRSPEEEADQEALPEETPVSFPIQSEGIRIRGWERGMLRFVLEAKTMELDKGGSLGKCSGGVRILVFEDNGELRATLESHAADVNLLRKNVRLRGNVVVTSSSGDRLETEELFYFSSEKTIQTRSPVRAYFKEHFLESEGFSSDVDLVHPEFFRVIRGTFHLESASP